MRNDSPPRLAVVSRSFPPQVSGSAVLMKNLLGAYRGPVEAVVGFNKSVKVDDSQDAPCPVHSLAPSRRLARPYEALVHRVPGLTTRLLIPRMARTLKRIRPDVILATLPHYQFMVAAYRVARMMNIPFYAYMHDLWADNHGPNTAKGRLATRWEPVILKNARRLICMTEFMQNHYQARYGRRGELLYHSVPDSDLTSAPDGMVPPSESRPTVLFIGNLSHGMNIDALRVLSAAMDLLPDEYELVCCTPASLKDMESLGIRNRRLRVQFLPRDEVRALQSRVNVLVAPLSHKDCSIGEVRTVFSTKLLEYMVSGRPILVFAPPDSYQAVSARERGWGLVVDQDSPEALAAGILRLVEQTGMAADLVRGALKEARRRAASAQADCLWAWVREDAR